MIPVTKTYLPPKEEYQELLNQIWKSKWLTNRGEIAVKLERKLQEYLESPELIITNNGTIPLQIALKLLGNKGEVITTPFSYIATLSSIIWEGCTPVFVDIDPEYLTIDENQIENAITNKTTVILATHVFGNPCNVEAIKTIASKYNLKVIYDAAHCFGVRYKGESIFSYGDISTCSFHATKIYHCGEGGAIFCSDPDLFHKCFYSHNFGHNGQLDYFGLGINGKISELQAAMGMAILPHMDQILNERIRIIRLYQNFLKESNVSQLKLRPGTEWNNSYLPVLFRNNTEMEYILKTLNSHGIFPRRYFYPSLNTVNFVNEFIKMPVSEDVASRVLCLPLYVGLKNTEVEKISSLIHRSLLQIT